MGGSIPYQTIWSPLAQKLYTNFLVHYNPLQLRIWRTQLQNGPRTFRIRRNQLRNRASDIQVRANVAPKPCPGHEGYGEPSSEIVPRTFWIQRTLLQNGPRTFRIRRKQLRKLPVFILVRLGQQHIEKKSGVHF